MKGVSGLSPYEIVHGRLRPLAHLPYEPERDCEDAIEFFFRMQNQDKKVAEIVNREHKKIIERENAGKVHTKPLEVGSIAWYRRPEGTAGPLDSRWLGPVKIVARVGEPSYEIEVKPGLIVGAPRAFLKPYVKEIWNGDPIPLHYHRRTILDEDVLPEEYIVDKIIGHKVLANGEVKFHTLWVGYKKPSWERASVFIQRYCYELKKILRGE